MLIERRDYAHARASKIAYWRSLTPADRLRLADELRRQVLLLHPDWPTADQRERDVSSHIQISERLGRVATARKR